MTIQEAKRILANQAKKWRTLEASWEKDRLGAEIADGFRERAEAAELMLDVLEKVEEDAR